MANLETEERSPLTEDASEGVTTYKDMFGWFINELTGSPINCALLVAICFIIYKILHSGDDSSSNIKVEPTLPPMKRRDFTLKQLCEYDGKGPDGRILIAVLGNVYDVTRGKRFYGPGGAYAGLAGRDASRALATFLITAVSEEYDDLSDLCPSELEQVKEWELQFSEKYMLVGKLLKPGEQPTTYSDDESDVDEEEEKLQKTAANFQKPITQ